MELDKAKERPPLGSSSDSEVGLLHCSIEDPAIKSHICMVLPQRLLTSHAAFVPKQGTHPCVAMLDAAG